MNKTTTEILLIIIIYFTIFIKIVFLISVIGDIFFSHYHKTSTVSKSFDIKFAYLKEQSEFVFVFCMAILLIIVFNPWFDNQKYINIHKDLGILFYLFGFILLFTANWSLLFQESHIFKRIKNTLGGSYNLKY